MEPLVQNEWYQKLTQPLLRSVFGHIRILFYDLDPIKDQSVYGFTKDDLLLAARENINNNNNSNNHHNDRQANRRESRLNSISQQLRSSSTNQTPHPHPPHLNLTYLFPFLCSLYIALDGLFLFAQNGFHYEPTKMETLFSHLVFPRQFWPQADIMVGLAIAMSVTVFPLLMVDPMLERKYVMYLLLESGGRSAADNCSSAEILMIGGGGGSAERRADLAALPATEAAAILSFRRRARPLISLMMAAITLQAESFTLWNVYHHWSGFSPADIERTGSELRLYLLALSTALFFFYGNVSNLYMLYYFGLAVRYVRVKQRCRRRRVAELAAQIDRKIASSFTVSPAGSAGQNLAGSFGHNTSAAGTSSWTNRQKQQQLLMNSSLWRRLQEVNRQMLALFEEIRAQNRFWSKYLTIYFVVYIIEIVYLSYSYLFLDTAELGILQLFFPLFAVNFMLVLVLVTLECSQVVAKNCQLYREMQRATAQLQRIYPLRVGDQLVVDSMAANYRNVPGICFKMLNNYRINSQMFQMVTLAD